VDGAHLGIECALGIGDRPLEAAVDAVGDFACILVLA
jgi:hypothetical protein